MLDQPFTSLSARLTGECIPMCNNSLLARYLIDRSTPDIELIGELEPTTSKSKRSYFVVVEVEDKEVLKTAKLPGSRWQGNHPM